MYYFPQFLFHIVTLVAILVLVSCGGGEGEAPPPPDTTPPSVISDSPTPIGPDVVRNTTVNVTFSEAMDIATLNSNFQVKESGAGGADVPGGIRANGNTYTFTPSTYLESNTSYDVTIKMGAADLAGNTLTAQEDWSFTTGSNMSVNISWDPNRETAVNTAGGGYKVFYSINQGFSIADTGVTEVEVPYVSGTKAPTSLSLKMPSDVTYYFRVVAYSALNPPAGSDSAPSTEYSLYVP